MPRVVLGNRGGVLALPQAGGVLAELSEGWPDVNIMQKTVRGEDGLLEALAAGRVNIALQEVASLPPKLPEGLTLAAVTKRLEPRAALVGRGAKSLASLAQGSVVGVKTPRDRAFLRANRKDVEVMMISGDVDANLARLVSGEVDALVLASAHLLQLERRERIDALLELTVFTPAVGQGALALVVKEDDDLANDLAYTLQHRPSFDRIRAERSFARALLGAHSYALGALASVTSEGDLNLFGAVADMDGDLVIQAEISGEAGEAEELGRELAQDVLEQLQYQTAPQN